MLMRVKDRPEVLNGNGWPYGAFGVSDEKETQERLIDWATHRKVRLSKPERRCFHWLFGRRCPKSYLCGVAGGDMWGFDSLGIREPDPHADDYIKKSVEFLFMDHVTAWVDADKEPALILAQPYGIVSGLVTLGQLAQVERLLTIVDTGWYGRGAVAVEMWNEPIYRKLHDARYK